MSQDQHSRTIKGAAIGPAGARAEVEANGVTEPNLPYGVGELSPAVADLIAQKQQIESDAALLAWVENKFTQMKNARSQQERQWYINLAFEKGLQYVAPSNIPGYGFRLGTPRAPSGRVRLVINKIRKAVRTECSKLSSSRPIPTVVPATNEREDQNAAVVGEQLLRTQFNTADFEETYRMGIWWAVVTGTGYLKQYWNPREKDYDNMQMPKWPEFPPGSGQPVTEDVLNQLEQIRPGVKDQLNTPIPSQGKICIDKVSPFHIYVPDLMSDRLEAQPFLIQTMTKTPEWVFNNYGFKATPDALSASTTLDISFLIAKTNETQFDSVLVKEVWIKPGTHPGFPEGGMLTVINNRIVQRSPKWPLPYPEYPFYKLNAIPTGGFYSDSLVVDLIPIQKEYNKTRSKATEIKNLSTIPRIMFQEGSVQPRKVTTEAGQWIPYTAGYEKPEVLPALEVPQSYINDVQMLQEEFDDIANQHDLTQNGDPASGTAMAFLQEQDDLLLVYQTSSIEYAMQTLGRHNLKLVSTFWDDDRVIKVAGKDMSFEVVHWKKNSLRGNTDVRIQTGSALPISKAAKQALITEMMQNGFLSPEVGLEILDMGDLDRMLSEYLTDKKQAMRENLKMAELPAKLLNMALQPHPGPQGEPPYEGPPNPDMPDAEPVQFNGDGTPFEPQPPIPVNSYDNHDAHIKWHNQYRKTQEFELLDDSNKQAFEMHVQLHQQAIMANQINAQGFIAQPGQAPPGGGNNMDPSVPSGGGPLGQDTQDPGFAEDPANLDAATSRARAVDARTQTGQFSNN